MKSLNAVALGGVLLVSLVAACAPKEETVVQPEETAAQVVAEPVPGPGVLTAVADLAAATGGTAQGRVTFIQSGDTVDIEAHVSGAPAGSLGFHLHETGDCSAADFTSAGGHFNPTHAAHASPTAAEHHAGDFGNIEIGPEGSGTLQISTTMLSVAEGPSSVVGRAVILHQKTDDLNTQPTGNAGARIACGVVTLQPGSAPTGSPAPPPPAGQ